MANTIEKDILKALKTANQRHPRLIPGTPLSNKPVENIMPFVTAEFKTMAKDMGLKGRAKARFVADKVSAAIAAINTTTT